MSETSELTQRYPHPPITEAIIELRFVDTIADDIYDRISKKLMDRYPNQNIQWNTGVHVNVDTDRPDKSTVTQERKDRIIRRSSHDEDEVVVLTPQSFIVSKLAPYTGWREFFDRFQQDWAIFKKVAGYRKVSRIGMRYVNRLDLPMADERVEYEQYFNLHIVLPSQLDPVSGFRFQVQRPNDELNCLVQINSATVPSPLPKCAGFLFDIDVFRTVEVPQKDADILEYLERVRELKNEIFEASVTDAARARFLDDNGLGSSEVSLRGAS